MLKEIVGIPRQKDELLVILIGGIKSGRTTFVRRFLHSPEARQAARVIKDASMPTTKDVVMYRVQNSNGLDVILMDTPGIDGGTEVERDIHKAYQKFPSHRVRVALIFFLKVEDAFQKSTTLQGDGEQELMARLSALYQPRSLFIVSTPPEFGQQEMGELEWTLRTALMNTLPKPWEGCQWTTKQQPFSPLEVEKESSTSFHQEFLDRVVKQLASSPPSILPGTHRPIDSTAPASSQDLIMEGDAIIVLMGPTGTGKSTFVDSALGTHPNGQRAHHGLVSSAAGMSTHRLVSQGRNIVLVDTPGFDDSSVSDADTLSHISEWLEKRYKDNVPILGLLYFHRITDNRMSGTLTQNLALFRNICGREGLKKVVLVTTMWDQVATQANGEAYETELKQKFWKPFMDQGSMTRRFDFQNAQNSASDIMDAIMSLPANTKPVLLQKQLVDIRLSLEQTNAGRVLYSQLHRYIRDRDGDFARYKEDYSEYETRIDKLQRDVDNLPKTEYETVLAEEERKQVQAVFDAFRGDFEDLKTTINQERTRVHQLKLTPLGWAKGGLAKVRHKIGL